MKLSDFDAYRITKTQNNEISKVSSNPWKDLPTSKSDAKKELSALHERLAELQQRFFVDRRKKLLFVLQGMDTSGKNGTIRHVFRGVNPQGVHVASFERPSTRELARDYLWRVHKRTPARGEIMIFDRSHYEDVLAVRVNKLKPPAIWRKRYRHINDFEQLLADEDTVILKFFLHIDRDTQKQRLQERLDTPAKNWKFDQSDLVARSKWSEYVAAYEEVFAKTSTSYAPWYIIPANKKWARNLLVARIVVSCLEDMHLSYPQVDYNPSEIVID
ncbi:polyphosphate kinase 2 family protein [Coraliomargarita sp. SDUM461004]|uniref:Polyphosphate kinase 2 family protein n=1 Tax=Thalassobacterium sedimentorum TaxID=3041258 RepID=A0ABU1AJF0_9BACT|nr:PPK2 family polyphosphate kinase [Coraliomargarita sp. SDUM461004]MDQ8194911.1 polyphosphate kinase 2 family protein [Coraliomargarita sp. SDUM461004]